MADSLDAFASATEMLAALRGRRISAVELLDLHKRRIARYNRINIKSLRRLIVRARRPS